MKTSATLVNSFAIASGIFFLAEGIWGLFSHIVFGYLTTNALHAILHLLIGTIGLTLGIRQTALGYCTVLGLALSAMGILFFLPYTTLLMTRFFNMNESAANLHLFLGVIALLVSLSTGSANQKKT